jgi:hypothetical protein
MTKRTHIPLVASYATLILIAGACTARGQTVLGKSPADKVLSDAFFGQNTNANATILGINRHGTLPLTNSAIQQLQAVTGGTLTTNADGHTLSLNITGGGGGGGSDPNALTNNETRAATFQADVTIGPGGLLTAQGGAQLGAIKEDDDGLRWGVPAKWSLTSDGVGSFMGGVDWHAGTNFLAAADGQALVLAGDRLEYVDVVKPGDDPTFHAITAHSIDVATVVAAASFTGAFFGDGSGLTGVALLAAQNNFTGSSNDFAGDVRIEGSRLISQNQTNSGNSSSGSFTQTGGGIGMALSGALQFTTLGGNIIDADSAKRITFQKGTSGGVITIWDTNNTAILTLGKDASATAANSLLALDGSKSVGSVTTSAGLAGVISDKTGSGALVFGTAPTLTTPTIASFANANHNHQNSAGGGSLDGAAIGSGTVALARGGTGSSLSDPGANQVLAWDDTDNTVGFWSVGSGLSYNHATHTLSATGGSGGPWSTSPATGNEDAGGFSLSKADTISGTNLTAELVTFGRTAAGGGRFSGDMTLMATNGFYGEFGFNFDGHATGPNRPTQMGFSLFVTNSTSANFGVPVLSVGQRLFSEVPVVISNTAFANSGVSNLFTTLGTNGGSVVVGPDNGLTVTSSAGITAGKVTLLEGTAPANPAANNNVIYVDSTSHQVSAKPNGGTVSVMVTPDAGAAHNFVTALSAAGAVSKAQPAQADITGLTTADSPQFTAVNIANTDTTISRSSAGIIAVEGVNIPTISSTDTLSNKRMTARITTITSSATPAVNSDVSDCVNITALAAAITSMTSSLSGTPNNFDQLEYRIKDDGTARAITWGTSFVAGPAALPTTTTISKALHVYFEWDAAQSKWVCMSSGSDA